MIMLKFLRLIASVLLIAPCKAEDVPYHYFGCGKNIDAVCSDRIANTGQQKQYPSRLKKALFLFPDENSTEQVTWAVRLQEGLRNYKCPGLCRSLCCWQNKFDIDGAPNKVLTVSNDATFDPCTQIIIVFECLLVQAMENQSM
ncbi:hypothetical protein KEM48_007982 [Puccinia striiformis f. sp. tritici PST-130]|nr:hypothetical protein KEM48_007982 [Puccinia striiformis f. sp. tritici PST-130]